MTPSTIYFIEDDVDNFLIFQRYRRLAGVTPPWVGSGTTGYTLFRWMETREQVPDLIFLDLRLQQGDGFQVLADIQSHPKRHDTRVIAVTAPVQELTRCGSGHLEYGNDSRWHGYHGAGIATRLFST